MLGNKFLTFNFAKCEIAIYFISREMLARKNLLFAHLAPSPPWRLLVPAWPAGSLSPQRFALWRSTWSKNKTLTLRRRSSQTFLLSGKYQKKYISKGFLNNTVTPTPWYTLLTRWLGLERYWREQEVGLWVEGRDTDRLSNVVFYKVICTKSIILTLLTE